MHSLFGDNKDLSYEDNLFEENHKMIYNTALEIFLARASMGGDELVQMYKDRLIKVSLMFKM